MGSWPTAAASAGASRFGRCWTAAFFWLVLLAVFSSATGLALASARTSSEVAALVDAGKFSKADASIASALAEAGVSEAERQALSFERERMRRIRLDFSLDRAAAIARAKESIPDLKLEEFDGWDWAGLIEHQDIDGKRWYFKRSVSNLFLLSAEASARRAKPRKPIDGPMESLNPHHFEVRAEALATGSSHVAPRRVRVTYSLDLDADAVPPGKTVRAWLPFPRSLPGQQEDINLVSSVPTANQLAPESALQRTVYLERAAEAGNPTKFSITYELTIYGQYHAIDPDKVLPATNSAELAPYLSERAPHVMFTPAMREFSSKVVGDERNPYRIAQKLFAAVDKIPWAGAREYSTITNISEYALHAGHADCGQQTLLLMTLLRLNGIPARWQSGWVYSDTDYDNMHDWGWLYLAPYGWVPMDVTFGRFQSDQPGMEWFYLGGLDAYRIAFNDDYSREFVPAKRHFRSETVDLQRGEVEWDGGNLYFDQWDYNFAWQLLPGNDKPSHATNGEKP